MEGIGCASQVAQRDVVIDPDQHFVGVFQQKRIGEFPHQFQPATTIVGQQDLTPAIAPP